MYELSYLLICPNEIMKSRIAHDYLHIKRTCVREFPVSIWCHATHHRVLHDTKAGSYCDPRSVTVSSDIYSLILIAFSKLASGAVQLNSTCGLVQFSMQGSVASLFGMHTAEC